MNVQTFPHICFPSWYDPEAEKKDNDIEDHEIPIQYWLVINCKID